MRNSYFETEKQQLYEVSYLGIPEEFFKLAINDGIAQFKNTNRFQPINAGGSKAYLEIVGVLRQLVISECTGWEIQNLKGISALINNHIQRILVITSGNEYTGTEYQPETKNLKGFVTNNYVNENVLVGQNLDLFDLDESDVTPKDPYQTWVFLYHFDKNALEVRSEISLPVRTFRVGDKYKITEWARRHILPVIPFDEIINIDSNEVIQDTSFFTVKKHMNYE